MLPQTIKDVAAAIGVPEALLLRAARDADKSYHVFVHRGGRRARTIHAPNPGLKQIQCAVKHRILAAIRPHPASFSRAGCSAVDHAKAHAGKPHILKVDLRRAFPSVRPSRVTVALQQAGIGRDAARLLTRLTTCRGLLPQGPPTSSLILEIVMMPLDREFARLAQGYDADYTRYADDLVFSGPNSLRGLLAPVRRALGAAGFEINREKLKVAGPNTRHMIAGVDVSSSPRPPQQWLERLTSTIDCADRHGLAGIEAQVRGSISWVRQIDPDIARPLLQRLASARARHAQR